MKTTLALLSLIAFSECFAHRGDIPFEDQAFFDHQEYHHAPYFHHMPHPRHFYPGVPEFRNVNDEPIPLDNDIRTNAIPRDPPCESKDYSNEDFGLRAFGAPQDDRPVSSTRDVVVPQDDKAKVTTSKSYIVGDFVFPDQVDNYKKKHQTANIPSEPLVKVAVGMERGVMEPVPDMENRNSFGMGKCPMGMKRIGLMCMPVGHL